MKTYTVTLPIVGVAYVEVKAESEETAIEKALDDCCMDDIEEWKPVRAVVKGNVCYADTVECSANTITVATLSTHLVAGGLR